MKKFILFLIGLACIMATSLATAQTAIPASYQTTETKPEPVYTTPLQIGERMTVMQYQPATATEPSAIYLHGVQDGIFVTVQGLRVSLDAIERELIVLPEWWTVTVQADGVLVQVSGYKNPMAALRLLNTILKGAYGYLIQYEVLKDCGRRIVEGG